MPKRNAVVQPVLLAVSLAIGAGAVWIVVVTWCQIIGSQFIPRPDVYDSVDYQVDGTPLIRTREGRHYYAETYRTLDGESVPSEEARRGLPAPRLYGPPSGGMRVARLDWHARMLGYTDLREPPTLWYFVHTGRQRGRGYFVGYDSETKSCVGYIGQDGFRPDLPPAEDCFPVDARRLGGQNSYGAVSHYDYLAGRQPQWYSRALRPGPGEIAKSTVHLISGDRLVEVDLEERTVREVIKSPGLVSVKTGVRALAELPPEDAESFPRITETVLLRMADRVVILDVLSGERREYQIPAPLRSRAFDFLELADGTAMAAAFDPVAHGHYGVSLHWFDSSGVVVRREDLRLRTTERHPSPTTKAWLLALNLPAPIATVVEATLFEPRRLVSWGQADGYSHALAKTWSYSWLSLVITCLVAIGLSWVCRRRQREHGAGWTGVWMAFVFLFGVPGFAGYLFHRSWAARPACPTCGEEAPRDREACFACGTDFPEPAPKGIEVFA